MLPITRKISKYNFYKGNEPKYIVIHYTGNAKDTAYNNAKYFNGGNRNASAHYFVDDTSIFQVVEDYNGAWHVGNTKTEVNNKNSIGIEMCCSGNYQVSSKTEENTIELVKYLMKKYNIPVENVRTHAEVTKYGKTCPNWSANSWSRWKSFKAKLVDKPTTTTKPITTKPVNYRVRIVTSSLNVRKEPNATSTIKTTVKKYEVYTIIQEKDGWGLLKSKIGWINLSDAYVEKIQTTTTKKFEEYKVKITTDVLNVRKEPTTASKVMTTVRKGQVFTIVGEENGFLKLKSGAGWISKNYVEKL